MQPDALLRMQVFQEGQRAFNAGTECPYTDWRAGTWAKGRAAAEKHYAGLMREPETVPCGICGIATRMTGTKRCDRCWELETRIKADPEIARQILESL